MTKTSIKKYLAEGFLIIFSVLFALYINKLSDDWQTTKKKNIALIGIQKELQRNSEVIGIWIKDHSEISERIHDLDNGKNDSLKNEMKATAYLDFGLLTGKESFISAILSNTAWETAKTTGIIAEFNFETSQELTSVYTMQNTIMDKTIFKIVDLVFAPESQNIENLDGTLHQFNLLFRELVGQENTLLFLYNRAKKNFDDTSKPSITKKMTDSIN